MQHDVRAAARGDWDEPALLPAVVRRPRRLVSAQVNISLHFITGPVLQP